MSLHNHDDLLFLILTLPAQCNAKTGQCDTQKGTCDANKCFSCLPATGDCSVQRNLTCFLPNKCQRCDNDKGCIPTDLANQCTPCETCDVAAGCINAKKCDSDKCFDCHVGDAGKCTLPRAPESFADKCVKCNALTGACDVPRNLTCVANKCYRCSATDGSCVFNTDIKCSPCEVRIFTYIHIHAHVHYTYTCTRTHTRTRARTYTHT